MNPEPVDTSDLDALREDLEASMPETVSEPTKEEVSEIVTYDNDASDKGKQTIVIDDNAEPELPDIEAYFDCETKSFLMKNNRGEWIPATEQQLKRELRKLGYRNRVQSGENISQVEQKLSEIHFDRDVSFSGPVAGYKVGLIDDASGRILVTKGPKIIEPEQGDWPTIKEFLFSLFGDQIDYVLSWLKVSYRSLSTGVFDQCWALVIAGKKANGKSFFQEHIVTPILGGRVGLPYRYMTGGSQFNSDLIGCEHLMIGDESPSTNIQKRKQFGERIKNFVVNETQSWHGKNKNQHMVRPLWRVTVSLNDEPEDLLMFPPLVDGLQDKITALKSSRASNLPTQDERASFREKISNELPAFIHYLMHEYEIPKEIDNGRMGVKAYQHPDILEALNSLTPEMKLDEYITEVLFGKNQPHVEEYTLRTTELEHKLRDSAFSRETDNLLQWNAACGTYLGRLTSDKETGKRYKKLPKKDGYSVWRILRNPVEDVDQTTDLPPEGF